MKTLNIRRRQRTIFYPKNTQEQGGAIMWETVAGVFVFGIIIGYYLYIHNEDKADKVVEVLKGNHNGIKKQ